MSANFEILISARLKSGAGADDVNAFLEKNYKDDMSLDDASALAIAAIELRAEAKEEKSK